MKYSQSIKYGDYLRALDKKRIEKIQVKENIIQSIISLCNTGKTNIEVCTILSMSLPKLQYWKKRIRDNGTILPVIISSGRPKQIKKCPHCSGIL